MNNNNQYKKRDSIVNDIKEFIDRISHNKDNKGSYIFGNTAFPDYGEINIGNDLKMGNDFISYKDKLNKKNKDFGYSLHQNESYSITNYLHEKNLRWFSLKFILTTDINKESIDIYLSIGPYDKETKRFDFVKGQTENDHIEKTCEWDDDLYPPEICNNITKKEEFKNKFCKTIEFYRDFCIIVKDLLIANGNTKEGYIYLIRPKDKDEAFDGLTYMFVKTKLGLKDIEIISLMLSSYYLEKLKDDAIMQSIKAAKAAIMSRNLSHNLGSHVMAYLKQDLSSVEEIIRNGVLEKLKGKEEMLDPNSTLEMPFLVGLGRFISYLQERQDFIATVCTDYIPYPSPVNFKDFIFDELNPDYRSKRHSERNGIAPCNILLQNIVKSEGLTRDYRWTKEGKIDEIHSSIFIGFRGFTGNDASSADLADLRKINVSLPGGVMGRQAFFSIMENVIRNAAKHGSWQYKKYLKLVIDIYEKRQIDNKPTYKFFKVAEADERCNIEDEELSNDLVEYFKEIDDDLYVISITDNTKSNESDVSRIQKGIDEKYVKGADNILIESNKGIKEMRISAAWLRGIQEELMGVPVLKVRLNKDPDSKESKIYNLQYLFCLPKVCKVALVYSDSEENDNFVTKNKELFKQHDWGLFTVSTFKANFNRSFEFIVLENENVHDKLRAYCHHRTCVNPSIASKAKEERFRFDEVEKELFKWLAGDAVDDTIAIFDNYKNENVDFDNIKSFETQNEKDNMSIPYVYRKHHDTRAEFNSFMQMRKGNYPVFVESISGGNSTDRLIRNATLDYRWFYTHIHAMKTRVAIFDERLFSKITRLDEKDLLFAVDWDKKWENLDDFSKMQSDLYNYDVTNENFCGISENFNTFIETITSDAIHALANKWYPFPSESKDFVPITFNQKGISFFTIVDNGKDGFAIWGCTNEIIEDRINYSDLEKRNDKCAIKKIAVLKLSEGKDGKSPIIIDFLGEFGRQFEKQFDYVSIHQGLLDKIYKKSIKVDKEEDSEKIKHKKKLVTSRIYNKFVKHETDKDDYLPGLFIHSGRSKPNEEDMPQKQPFLQYAAIEHAVMDCKYELVQLLDFAKYI